MQVEIELTDTNETAIKSHENYQQDHVQINFKIENNEKNKFISIRTKARSQNNKIISLEWKYKPQMSNFSLIYFPLWP